MRAMAMNVEELYFPYLETANTAEAYEHLSLMKRENRW